MPLTDQEKIAQAASTGASLPGYNGTADYQHVYYEANGQPYWKKVGGGKMYVPPASAMSMFDDPKAVAWAKSQGYEIKGGRQGLDDASKSYVDAQGYTRMPESPVTMADQGGGLWRTTGTWNSQTGKFESGVDWGNVLTMVVAGVITAGAATAMMGGSTAASSAATTAASTGSVNAGLSAGGLTAIEAGITTPAAAAAAGIPIEIVATAAPSAAGIATGAGIAATPFVAAFGTENGPYVPPYGGATNLPSTPSPSTTNPLPTSSPSGAVPTTGSVVPPPPNTNTPRSWLTSPYAGLVSQGIGAIGDIVGANIAAGAQEKALAQQQAQFDKALAAEQEVQTYNRNQYGDYLGRLAPYNAAGNEATARLSQYMGTPQASGGTTVPSTVPAPAPLPPAATVAPPQSAPASGTPSVTTVRMRAPDGTEQDVPAGQVAHYREMGATVVGNRYTTMGAA